ncbi:hypothetical protein [Sabulicella rubraurantiaca]|uniref:hypothetical protein n=1 Tax=Sabulicella rubraurantiaca TaxID=2811429 RepID=UPI001A9757A4|nr:hypothetical protein [Sabulicella rubraurantiaca]
MTAAAAADGFRQRSLRVFIAVSVALVVWRLLLAVAFLLFGPPLDVAPQHHTTQIFFVLSKAVLGGLFWPVSLALSWRDPVGWLFYPW